MEELFHFIRNKLPFYQRGLRALNLYVTIPLEHLSSPQAFEIKATNA